MSEDTKSTVTKGGRRFLYVANPGSDESSGEEDNKRPQAEGSSQPQGFTYKPPPLPSTSSQPRPSKPMYPQYAPSPLTTNLPIDHGHHYQSSRSNPTLSSPSSTSSPAVESTPPPSTPSLSAPAIDLTGDASIRQEPQIGLNASERGDGSHVTVRPTGLFEKFKAHLPYRSPNQQRTSGNSYHSNTSPTASIESYTSPTNTQYSRSTPVDKLLIMVTTDADQYLAVEVYNAKNAAVIRERIFTKLHISDEDQAQYSIYRTKIGRFAIGEALTDEQLFALCCEQGDDEGFLRFFVSHSSAQVHEVSNSAISPTTVSTIPPPVLPFNNGAYAALRPQRRGQSRSGHGSASSASERLPPEVGAGYEASVSDDLDNADRDGLRSTMRPPASRSMAAAFKNFPSSPDRGRRPSAPLPRPMSPIYTLRPASPPANTRDPGPEIPPTRVDQYGTITPTPPPAPPPPLSPNCATFDENSLTPPAQIRHGRSGSDAAAQREQILEASESQLERQWQLQREERGKLDRPRDRGEVRKEHEQRDKQPSVDVDEISDKTGSPDWVFVPSDTPRAANKSQDGLRTSPPVSKERNRNHNFSPFKSAGYGGRPPIPNPPRNPPPPPPVGGGDTRSNNSRGAGQAVPSKWVVGWKVADKGDQKVPVSTPQWSRMTAAKSMTDLRNPALNNHPTNLQPGQRRGNQLPVTPERREGISIPTPSNTYGDSPSSASTPNGTYLPGVPKSYEVHRTLPRPLPKHSSPSQNTLNYSQSPPHSFGMRVPPLQPSTSNYTNLISPGGDLYPRPQSAFGNSVTPPTPQRYPNRHDTDDNDTLHSPHPISPLRQGAISGRLALGRDDSTPISQSTSRHGLRLNPNALGTYVSTRPSDSYGGSEAPRTPPRSPASPQSPRHGSRPNTGDTPGGLLSSTSGTSLPNDDESANSSATLRQDNREWLRQMLDGNDSNSATLIPKAVDIGQYPMPVPPPLSPLPPIPSQQNNTSFSQSLATVVADESDSDDDDGGTLWQTKPAPKSPQSKSSPDKSLTRGPPLTLQTDKITSVPPSSFRGIKGPEHLVASRPPPDPPHSERRLAPLTANSGKKGQRGSTFTDNEYTWAPRPAAEEVYDRLEEFFPEHDLDMPVIEATSGTGSPTTAEYPAAPPVPDKDKPEKGLIRGKKSIRIVAEEHKKRIDRTSRPDNIANVLRKRSTKLWGSRLEEVTTEQAKAEYARSLYVKPAPAPESPSGGPRPIFKWVRGELIGKGTYGRVYLALNATTGEMIAVKQVEIPQTASDKNDSRQAVFVQALKLESEIFKDLDHPNVVQYLGFEETPNFLSIFLEYVPGGSIGSCLLKHGKFDEEVTKSFTEQILTGLEYLHSKGILHRDLKADNILVETTGVCKISDFGIAKRTDNIDGLGASTAMQGTVFWMAPEVIDPMKKGYDKKVDIWSVGCVVHEMWAGKRPWSGDEAIAVILKLHKSKLPPPIPDDVVLSPLAHNFRSKCFAINPEERPTAAELRRHPYLTLPSDWIFSGFKSDL